MIRAYKIFRSILVSLLILTVGIPAILYLTLWLPPVQDSLRDIAEEQLTGLLGTKVDIGTLRIEPFTRISISDISVADPEHPDLPPALTVQNISGGFSITSLFAYGRIVITDVELIGPSARITRAAPGTPLNIAPILKRLRSDSPDSRPKRFSLSIHTTVLRQGAMSYDVLSAANADPGRFDPNHIAVTDLKADVAMPTLADNHVKVSLKRLSLTERSGFRLKELHADGEFTDTLLRISNFTVMLPGSSLRIGDLQLPYPSPGELVPSVMGRNHRIDIIEGSRVFLPDLAMFAPPFAKFRTAISVEAAVSGTPDSISVEKLNFAVTGADTWLRTKATIADALHPEIISAKIPLLQFEAPSDEILATISAFAGDTPGDLERIVTAMGRVNLSGTAAASAKAAEFDGHIATSAGSLDIDVTAAFPSKKSLRIKGAIDAENLDMSAITGHHDFGNSDFSVTFDMATNGRHKKGNVDLNVGYLTFKEHIYSDITANVAMNGNRYEGQIEILDENIAFAADGAIDLSPDDYMFDFTAAIRDADFDRMGLWHKFPGHRLSADIDARFSGNGTDSADGSIVISRLNFTDSIDNGLHLSPIALTANTSDFPQHVTLESDVVRASLNGRFNFANLLPTLKSMLPLENIGFASSAVHQTPAGHTQKEIANDFTLSLTILENREFFDFFNPPVKPLYPVSVHGSVCQMENTASLSISAPYLQQGQKLIRRSNIDMILGRESQLRLSTTMPTKDGDALLNLGSAMDSSGIISTKFDWQIERQRDFYGVVEMDTRLVPDSRGVKIHGADVNIRPGILVFNDTTWNIEPAMIAVRSGQIDIDNLNIHRGDQAVTISGTAAADSTDMLCVNLRDINLDYLFETLNINEAVIFGGTASGTVIGKSLLSKEPQLHTDDLAVRSISYNYAVLGDATVKAGWDNSTKGIVINADIHQKNDRHARINGSIFPLAEALDLHFAADNTPVGFLQPFMKAFASEVSGSASGHARLYGTFKLVDMTGDLLANNFSMRLDQTNVSYYATDSIKMTPGLIDIKGLTLRDRFGHTARLDGKLTHKFFKEPKFNFRVSNADNLLVFDKGPSVEQQWSGTVFASGSAYVDGIPGRVDIGATMVTDPGSEFTFTLSDATMAGEYTFITFRDRNAILPLDTLNLKPGSPELDRVMRDKVRKRNETAATSIYNMSLNIDINPNTRMVLVMDPVAGDKITAYGSGHANVIYSSGNDDFRIFGDYTIQRGDYNFTLQDIIIKNFAIVDGSSVAFTGNLDKTQLDIDAIYALKANLSDLDESFLNDKEVGRTNVTVNAVLQVDGSLMNPDINFDLKFPTLTSDVERKVHSIVSTKEMMNRQIIYLLALNRFYTPDYMSSTTKGNELMSVASSTISSQLSNILGQISDKFSVAPTLRSNAGDFSDVEFDVALSSTLLNNRLLLNGNFGYRDKMLNNNQFVGDFDIEYLLNRKGNWRLKAYNHFNDRNLYVKTALTTQGIGLVFKHDFNNFLDFFGKKKYTGNQQ